MATLANDRAAEVRELPAAAGAGQPVADVLRVPSLAGAQVLGGVRGLDRIVRRVDVMAVPDVLPWVKPHELLITTGYPLAALGPARVIELIEGLAERGVAALAVTLGRDLADIPDEAVARADDLGFPLIALRADTAVDEVLSDVLGGLLDRHTRELARADELHRALAGIVLEGGDLPQVAEELARLLDAAVLITSPDGRVQAEGGRADLRDELAAQPLFDGSGRFRVEDLRRGVQPAGAGELVAVSIVAGGVDHGRIAAYQHRGVLRGPSVHALERAATVAALVITKQLAVWAVESKFRGDYLRDVLAGNAGDAAAVVTHCASLGWDVDRPLVVVVAELDDDVRADGGRLPPGTALRSHQDRFTSAWTQVMRVRDRRAPVVGFAHEVVALVPLTGDVREPLAARAAATRAVAEMVAAVSGDGGGGRRSFCAGVSRPIDGVLGLPDAYGQARKAVTVGRRVRGRGSVAHFDSLGVHRLLSQVPDGGELRGFALEVLRDLARDTAEAADLRTTLQTLLDTNLNVAETARLLHFHYNTLRYRIGKLERIVGPFTTDPHLRLDVALALQVVQMRGL